MKRWMILGGLFCLFCGLASANVIPTFVSVTGSGPFTYTYSAELNPDQNLVMGDQFCFADVAGLTGTPTGPTADWSASNRLSSACPINAGTTVPNVGPSVLYTYNSATTIDGPSSLGTFTFQSTIGTTTPDDIGFGATAVKNSGPSAGSATANQGNITGPTSVVPEPEWSAMLLGLGLLAFAGIRRKFPVL